MLQVFVSIHLCTVRYVHGVILLWYNGTHKMHRGEWGRMDMVIGLVHAQLCIYRSNIVRIYSHKNES